MEGWIKAQMLETWEKLTYCAWQDCGAVPAVYFRWRSPALDDNADSDDYEEYYCEHHGTEMETGYQQDVEEAAQKYPGEMHAMNVLLEVELLGDSDRSFRDALEAELRPGGVPDR